MGLHHLLPNQKQLRRVDTIHGFFRGWRWDFCSRPSAALASSVPGGTGDVRRLMDPLESPVSSAD